MKEQASIRWQAAINEMSGGSQAGLRRRKRQPIVGLDFAGGGKRDGKGKGMQFGGKGRMSPMQIIMAAINAVKGGGDGFNSNNCNNSKGGIIGGKGGKDSDKGCYNCGGNRMAREWPQPKKETRECYKCGEFGHLA